MVLSHSFHVFSTPGIEYGEVHFSMERDYKKDLAGFEAVWKRVCGERSAVTEGIKLMPRREAKSAAVRYGRRRP